VPGKSGMTVIVVPETGRRTVTFRFSLLWLVPLVVVVAGLAGTVYVQHQANKTLESSVSELDTLRRTNRRQEAEIETLRNKVTETDQKLAELQALEVQVREIIGQSEPSRGGTSVEPVHTSGRGGPPDTGGELSTNMPSLGAMLPPEVRAYLFTPRDTLPMDLREPSARRKVLAKATASVDELQSALDRQLAVMDRLAVDMNEGKQAVEEQMDYLAHRPSGLPVSGGIFTDRFGWRWSPFGWGRQWHDGLDIAHDFWTPIVSTADGVVAFAGWKSGGYGYTVMVDHGYGLVTMYAHMAETEAEVGDEVRRGAVVGYVGNTGNSTGPHCHYEVHLNGVPVDPVKYLQ